MTANWDKRHRSELSSIFHFYCCCFFYYSDSAFFLLCYNFFLCVVCARGFFSLSVRVSKFCSQRKFQKQKKKIIEIIAKKIVDCILPNLHNLILTSKYSLALCAAANNHNSFLIIFFLSIFLAIARFIFLARCICGGELIKFLYCYWCFVCVYCAAAAPIAT